LNNVLENSVINLNFISSSSGVVAVVVVVVVVVAAIVVFVIVATSPVVKEPNSMDIVQKLNN
jgi:Flp pilus assembly protein TadG